MKNTTPVIFMILSSLFVMMALTYDNIRVMNGETTNKKGIAMAYVHAEDLERIGEDIWYYVWGNCPQGGPPNCVPMSRNGDNPKLPSDYSGYIILFNEPNNPEPFGHPIEPQDAIDLYISLYDLYPGAKWVVGNVNIYHREWMQLFWKYCKDTPECVMPRYIGWHIYVDGYNEAKEIWRFLDGIHQLEFPNTFWWITEFADVRGNIPSDYILEKQFKERTFIHRWAYFTNRATGEEEWYPDGWKVQLFDFLTGNPTEIGKWYSNKSFTTYLPVMMKRSNK